MIIKRCFLLIEMKRLCLHLTTLTNADRQARFVIGSDRNVFNFPHNQQSVNDSAEHDVLVVQEITFGAGDEELTAVRVLAAVGH